MLKISKGLQPIKFDQVGYTKTLNKILGQIVREAAREWLRAVLVAVPSRGGFPVLTGAAKATLQPLGRFLRVAVPVRPRKRSRISEGHASQEFNIVDDKNNGGSLKFSFEWSTDLTHFYINEFYGVIPSAPWMVTAAGAQAFEEFLQRTVPRRIPKLGKFFNG